MKRFDTQEAFTYPRQPFAAPVHAPTASSAVPYVQSAGSYVSRPETIKKFNIHIKVEYKKKIIIVHNFP